MRVVIYARGTAEEIRLQTEQCYRQVVANGWEIAALAQDQPDTWKGWDSAHAVIHEGRADRVLMTTRQFIPRRAVDSITRDVRPEQRTTIIRQTEAGDSEPPAADHP
jgi:hypothetical protein